MKSQAIRLIDVFFIGPVMIRAGYHLKKRPIGPIISVLGLLTIIYNLQNYMRYQNG